MYKNCVLFFSAAGYHSRNDSAENSKYIWKTYGIKKAFETYTHENYFSLILKFVTNRNLKMLTYQLYGTYTTYFWHHYLLQSVQTSSYILYLDSS